MTREIPPPATTYRYATFIRSCTPSFRKNVTLFRGCELRVGSAGFTCVKRPKSDPFSGLKNTSASIGRRENGGCSADPSRSARAVPRKVEHRRIRLFLRARRRLGNRCHKRLNLPKYGMGEWGKGKTRKTSSCED